MRLLRQLVERPVPVQAKAIVGLVVFVIKRPIEIAFEKGRDVLFTEWPVPRGLADHLAADAVKRIQGPVNVHGDGIAIVQPVQRPTVVGRLAAFERTVVRAAGGKRDGQRGNRDQGVMSKRFTHGMLLQETRVL